MSAAWLIPVSGPPIQPVALKAKLGGLLIGRHESSDIRLAHDAVSRTHARLCARANVRAQDGLAYLGGLRGFAHDASFAVGKLRVDLSKPHAMRAPARFARPHRIGRRRTDGFPSRRPAARISRTRPTPARARRGAAFRAFAERVA